MSSRNLNMYLAHKKWETIDKFEREIKLLSCQEIKIKMKDISNNIKSVSFSVCDFYHLETLEEKIHALDKWYNSVCK